MRWLLYNLLFVILYPIAVPYFLYRMVRRGGYGRGFMQRFGVYDAGVRSKLQRGPRTWLHAVSVGEAYVALRIMEACRAAHPGALFVLSTTTSTAFRLVEQHLAQDDVVIYFPIDFPVIMRRVLKIIRPNAIAFTEIELWPNLIRIAREEAIPLILVNGRLSESSFRGYRRLRWFFTPVINMLDRVCVQSDQDADRYRELGCDESRLRLLGSAKYDVALADGCDDSVARSVLSGVGVPEGSVILLGGSTWDGEERILAELYVRLRRDWPDVWLVLVPRHFERSDDVEKDIAAAGCQCIRRSRPRAVDVSPDRPPVLLVDSTGELKSFYAGASLTFVGKSLTRHGGQNVLEAAACGKPVVVGPNMENFPGIMKDLLAADAIIQVDDALGLEVAIVALVSDAAARSDLGERARQAVAQNCGAVDATVRELQGLIEP